MTLFNSWKFSLKNNIVYISKTVCIQNVMCSVPSILGIVPFLFASWKYEHEQDFFFLCILVWFKLAYFLLNLSLEYFQYFKDIWEFLKVNCKNRINNNWLFFFFLFAKILSLFQMKKLMSSISKKKLRDEPKKNIHMWVVVVIYMHILQNTVWQMLIQMLFEHLNLSCKTLWGQVWTLNKQNQIIICFTIILQLTLRFLGGGVPCPLSLIYSFI